jgi:flagellar biosynthesis/type III secretory pathway protein FliH
MIDENTAVKELFKGRLAPLIADLQKVAFEKGRKEGYEAGYKAGLRDAEHVPVLGEKEADKMARLRPHRRLGNGG